MRDIALITLARVIVIACQLINIKLFTNYLTATQIGLYFFFLTISYFANALIFGPVDYYQQANLRKTIDATGGVFPLLSFNLKLIRYYCLILILTIFAGMLFLPQFTYQIIFAGSLAVALYATQAFRSTLNNLDHKKDVSFNLVQEAVLKVITFLLLVKYFQPSELLLMAAWLITLIVSAVTLYLRAKKYGLFICNEKQVIQAKEVFHFSCPISVGAVANWIQLQGYRLILVPLGFAEVVGIFATVASIGSAGMAAAATIFSQAFSPNIYKTSGKYTPTYLKNAALLTGSILLVAIVAGKLIVTLATNPIFEPYWSVMLFGVLMDGSNLVIGAFAVHITLTSSTKKIMNSSFVGVIALLLSFSILFFTKNINAFTIGVPLVLSQLFVSAYMYWNFRKCSTQ
jgi:O-antigen/teichoic acid export membrane protein